MYRLQSNIADIEQSVRAGVNDPQRGDYASRPKGQIL
jgi:hypothetical protein